MKDAPPASDKEPYTCGKGQDSFTEQTESTNYNFYAKCSECFTKALQVEFFPLVCLV